MTRRLAPALIALLLSGCPDGGVRKDEVPQRPRPALRLLVLTDLSGTLEPCGCTSRPLGGIDRMAAAIAETRKGGAPTLVVHAGDLFFGPGPHAPGDETPTQEIWKAETVAEVLGRIGLGGAAPGRRDLSHGPALFTSLAEKVGFPLLGASVRVTPTEDEARSLPAVRVVEVGGRRVGLVGVLWPHPTGDWPAGATGPDDPLVAAREAVGRARADGAELVIALVHGSRRNARDAAQKLDVDLVVMGGLSEEEPIPPAPAGDAMLLHAGRQGQGLLEVNVWPRGEGGWSDVGSLGRQAAEERLRSRIDDLRRRIAEWEADESVDEADVQGQRDRLAEMEGELEELTAGHALPEEGNVIAARYRELPPEAPRDPQVTAVLDRFFRKVNQHNQRVYADVEPPPVPEGSAEYVGSQACAECHAEAVGWWEHTPHGRAYATLVKRHKEFNLDCVACHVTGYGEPGGSTVTHVDDLKNVGCESCHGPGGVHVKAPEQPLEHMQTAVPERVCVQCHNAEHSDLFQYEAYRNVLIMPGHGLPPKEDP